MLQHLIRSYKIHNGVNIILQLVRMLAKPNFTSVILACTLNLFWDNLWCFQGWDLPETTFVPPATVYWSSCSRTMHWSTFNHPPQQFSLREALPKNNEQKAKKKW